MLGLGFKGLGVATGAPSKDYSKRFSKGSFHGSLL